MKQKHYDVESYRKGSHLWPPIQLYNKRKRQSVKNATGYELSIFNIRGGFAGEYVITPE